MEIINGLTCYRVSCLSTTRESDRTIGMRLIDVTAIANKLLYTVYNSVKAIGLPQFKVDDSVCVSKFKIIFEKGYTPNWTTEMFRIVKKRKTNPVTYLLEEYRGKLI